LGFASGYCGAYRIHTRIAQTAGSMLNSGGLGVFPGMACYPRASPLSTMVSHHSIQSLRAQFGAPSHGPLGTGYFVPYIVWVSSGKHTVACLYVHSASAHRVTKEGWEERSDLPGTGRRRARPYCWKCLQPRWGVQPLAWKPERCECCPASWNSVRGRMAWKNQTLD
jgi:hypothetical protein